jgi:hypothetical protein
LCRPRGGLVNGDGDSCSHTFNIAADRARPGRIVIGLLRSHGFDRAGHGSAEPASSVVTRIPVVSAARGHPLALNTDETHHEAQAIARRSQSPTTSFGGRRPATSVGRRGSEVPPSQATDARKPMAARGAPVVVDQRKRAGLSRRHPSRPVRQTVVPG